MQARSFFDTPESEASAVPLSRPLPHSLQALASCSSVLRQLTEALRQLERCQPPGQASSSSAAPAAPLAAALLDVLQLLQPHAAPSQTVVPRRLVDVFRGKLPPGVLEAGEEHDAAEAVEELCRLVAEEMQACFARCVQPQLAARAALAAALERRSAAGLLLGSTASRSCGSEASLAKLANGQAAPACNGHAVAAAADGAAAAQASAAAAAEAALDSSRVREPSGQPANAVLQGWQQQLLPLHGSTAHELQCLRCRHRSVVQLSPFWVLSLPIPTARGTTLLGNVPAAPAASLQHCLASAFGYEALQGWHCTRCSLAASLEAAQQPAAAAAAGEAEASLSAVVVTDAANSAAALGLAKQQEHQPDSAGALQAQLQRLHLGLAGGGRLAESESYGRMLSEAGEGLRYSTLLKVMVFGEVPGLHCCGCPPSTCRPTRLAPLQAWHGCRDPAPPLSARWRRGCRACCACSCAAASGRSTGM